MWRDESVVAAVTCRRGPLVELGQAPKASQRLVIEGIFCNIS